MITIIRCGKPEEAHMARLRLEQEGIKAFVLDEHLVQLNWLYSNAIGGVRVQVEAQDAERAREVLNMPEPGKSTSFFPSCPNCGSEDIQPHTLMRRLALLSLVVFYIPIPFNKWKLRCLSCKNTWTWEKGTDP